VHSQRRRRVRCYPPIRKFQTISMLCDSILSPRSYSHHRCFPTTDPRVVTRNPPDDSYLVRPYTVPPVNSIRSLKHHPWHTVIWPRPYRDSYSRRERWQAVNVLCDRNRRVEAPMPIDTFVRIMCGIRRICWRIGEFDFFEWPIEGRRVRLDRLIPRVVGVVVVVSNYWAIIHRHSVVYYHYYSTAHYRNYR